jgi:hypothetical protein
MDLDDSMYANLIEDLGVGDIIAAGRTRAPPVEPSFDAFRALDAGVALNTRKVLPALAMLRGASEEDCRLLGDGICPIWVENLKGTAWLIH